MTPTLLITKDPSHPLAHLALRYAQAFLEHSDNPLPTIDTNVNTDKVDIADKGNSDEPAKLQLFFYADAAHLANQLRWQSADQLNLTRQWQALASQHKITLPVCVSTALSRGVSDSDNSARHQLPGDNLAEGFELVGLSELAMMLRDNSLLLQF